MKRLIWFVVLFLLTGLAVVLLLNYFTPAGTSY
jgi:hypothetical protein